MSEYYNSLPPHVRKVIYLVFGTLSFVAGLLQTAYLTLGGDPTWLTIAVNALSYTGTAFSFTAFSNTPTVARVGTDLQNTESTADIDEPGQDDDSPEHDYQDPGYAATDEDYEVVPDAETSAGAQVYQPEHSMPYIPEVQSTPEMPTRTVG